MSENEVGQPAGEEAVAEEVPVDEAAAAAVAETEREVALRAEAARQLALRAEEASLRRRLVQSPKLRLRVVTPRREEVVVVAKTMDRVRVILDRSGSARDRQVLLGDRELDQEQIIAALPMDAESVFRILPELPPTVVERLRRLGFWTRLRRAWEILWSSG